MKTVLQYLVICLLFNFKVHSQGFPTAAINWPVPAGGNITSSGLNNGFFLSSYTSANLGSIGTQNWVLTDINGDGKSDIVVTSEYMSNGDITVYSPSSNPYWKVYFNTGSGFSTAATNWPVPAGGNITSSGLNNGFFLSSYASANFGSIGTQNWVLTDINGDGKSDIVVTSEYMSNGDITVYSPSSNPYWKVYLNNTTSGISGLETDFIEVTVYPNPTKDYVTIKSNNIFESANYTVTDNAGKLVMTAKLFDEITTLDMGQLENGSYFIQIGEQKNQTIKVIKQ